MSLVLIRIIRLTCEVRVPRRRRFEKRCDSVGLVRGARTTRRRACGAGRWLHAVLLLDRVAQLLLGVIIAAFWLLTFSSIRPFPSASENAEMNALNLFVVFAMLGVLGQKLDSEDETQAAITTTRCARRGGRPG